MTTDDDAPMGGGWIDPPSVVHSCYDEMPFPLKREDWRCSCGLLYRVQNSQRKGFYFSKESGQ